MKRPVAIVSALKSLSLPKNGLAQPLPKTDPPSGRTDAHAREIWAGVQAAILQGKAIFPCWWITDTGNCACPKGSTCDRPGKHPCYHHRLITQGLVDASKSLKQVQRWWTKWPHANIAANCGLSGDATVDVDAQHGGLKTWAGFVEKYGAELERTIITDTPSGGFHARYHDGGAPVSSTVGTYGYGVGIDSKSRGGYVLLPPSNHLKGIYRYRDGHAPGQVKAAKLPEALRQIINAAAATKTKSKLKVDELLKGVKHGERDAALVSLLGRFRWAGLPIEAAVEYGSKFAVACTSRCRIEEHGGKDCPVPYKETDEAWVQSKANYVYGKYSPGDVALATGTDDGLAVEFVNRHGTGFRHAALRGWYVYDGTRFRFDDIDAAPDIMREFLRFVADHSEAKRKKSILSARSVTAIDKLARTDRRIALRPDDFDRDPWTLNTPDGLVDLKTGEVRPARPEDLNTKLTAVGPSEKPECPRWITFLHEVMDGDEELVAFIKRKLGYVLTGIVTEHDLTFLWGVGRNGKGVLIDTVFKLLGDYSAVAPKELFLTAKFEAHPTGLASLAGARFVTANETELGHEWAVAQIKMLTGGDKLKARFMREDFFHFDPTFKLWIAGNYRPALPRGANIAILDRLHLLPFLVVFRDPGQEGGAQLAKVRVRDRELANKLMVEWPGILRWLIEGCLEWQQKGLVPPPAVRAATEQYVQEEDRITRWIAECCERVPGAETLSSALFESFKTWAFHANEHAGTNQSFSALLADDHGFEKKHGRGGTVFIGLKLRSAPAAHPSVDPMSPDAEL